MTIDKEVLKSLPHKVLVAMFDEFGKWSEEHPEDKDSARIVEDVRQEIIARGGRTR